MAIIPDHVTGGDDFLCEVRGVKFLVTTPPGALPGQRIHVIVPRQLQTANNSSDEEYEDDSTGEVWEEDKVDRNDLFEDDDDKNRVMSMTEVEKESEIFQRLDIHRHKFYIRKGEKILKKKQARAMARAKNDSDTDSNE
jgi:hypothetical protein